MYQIPANGHLHVHFTSLSQRCPHSKQQHSKGLNTPPGGRLTGNEARGYTKARTT